MLVDTLALLLQELVSMVPACISRAMFAKLDWGSPVLCAVVAPQSLQCQPRPHSFTAEAKAVSVGCGTGLVAACGKATKQQWWPW